MSGREHFLVATTFGRGIWKTKYEVLKDIYVNKDCIRCGLGTETSPFETVEEAEEIQAHGQNWIIEGGVYPVSNQVIVDKNISVIEVNGQVTIGN